MVRCSKQKQAASSEVDGFTTYLICHCDSATDSILVA